MKLLIFKVEKLEITNKMELTIEGVPLSRVNRFESPSTVTANAKGATTVQRETRNHRNTTEASQQLGSGGWPRESIFHIVVVCKHIASLYHKRSIFRALPVDSGMKSPSFFEKLMMFSIFEDKPTRRFRVIERPARQKLEILAPAQILDDWRIAPGNRL